MFELGFHNQFSEFFMVFFKFNGLNFGALSFERCEQVDGEALHRLEFALWPSNHLGKGRFELNASTELSSSSNGDDTNAR